VQTFVFVDANQGRRAGSCTPVSGLVIIKLLFCYQATGYASQHIWCLSQARINWEGCAGRASGIKMVAMAKVGHQLVWIGGSLSGLLVCLPVLSSFCTRKF